jgi:hypothetical protein
MPRPPFPIVEPFTISRLGCEFVDRRDLEPEDEALAGIRWCEEMAALVERNGSLTQDLICGSDYERPLRASERFRDAQIARPDIGWEAFVNEGGELENEMDPRPDMPEFFLCARDALGEWVGGVSISNIRIERDTEGPLTASGFFAAGVPSGLDGDGPGWNAMTVHAIYHYILERALFLRRPGRNRLRFVQYNFLGTPGMRQTMNENPEIKAFLDLMRRDFAIRGDRTNRAAHIRFRSRTADGV